MENIKLKTALVIDDEKIFQMVNSKLLKKIGYDNVQIACNGQEGLEAIKSNSFDIVLSDIEMPVMNGLECVSQLRKWEKETGRSRQKMFCITGANIEKGKILETGMDGIIKKPISKDSLTALLKSK